VAHLIGCHYSLVAGSIPECELDQGVNELQIQAISMQIEIRKKQKILANRQKKESTQVSFGNFFYVPHNLCVTPDKTICMA